MAISVNSSRRNAVGPQFGDYDDIVRRERLVQHVVAAEKAKLTFITAPRGYGKSTLLAQTARAAHESGRAIVWRTLDEESAEPAGFVRALIEAIEAVDVDVRKAKKMLDDAGDLARAIDFAVRALIATHRPALICLEEYNDHGLPEIDVLLQSIFRYPAKDVRVVVATRCPAFSGAGVLELKGEILTLTARDLQFTLDEIRLFLPNEVSPETLATILSRTEGWPAGARLAKRFLSDNADEADLLLRLNGTDPVLADYLAHTVYNQLPEDMRCFLKTVACVRSFDKDIADAIRDTGDSTDYLKRIRKLPNVFIQPLRDGHGFRFHRLFGEFLEEEFDQDHSSDERRELHARAADYYAKQERILDALEHAIAARDYDRMRSILANASGDFFWIMKDDRFSEIMENLKNSEFHASPHFLAVEAYYHLRRADFGAASAILDKCWMGDSAAATTDDGDWCACDCLVTQAAYNIYTDQEQRPIATDDLVRLAYEGEDRSVMFRGLVFKLYSVLQYRAGEFHAAQSSILRAKKFFTQTDAYHETVRSDLFLADLALIDADGEGAETHISSAKALCATKAISDPLLIALADFANAKRLYHRGDVRAAEKVCNDVFPAINEYGQYWWTRLAHAYQYRAMISSALGEPETAYLHVAEGRGIARKRDFPRLQPALLATQAHIASIHGDRGTADRALEKLEAPQAVRDGEWRGENDWLVNLYSFIAGVRYDIAFSPSLTRAGQALKTAREQCESSGYGLIQLKFDALEILLNFRTGDRSRASKKLQEFLKLAHPLGIYAPLLEEGAFALEMLDALSARFRRTDPNSTNGQSYITFLERAWDFNTPNHPLLHAPKIDQEQLLLLKLFNEGASRDKISEKLGVAAPTADKRMRNLLNWLHCSSRHSAVAKYRRIYRQQRAKSPDAY